LEFLVLRNFVNWLGLFTILAGQQLAIGRQLRLKLGAGKKGNNWQGRLTIFQLPDYLLRGKYRKGLLHWLEKKPWVNGLNPIGGVKLGMGIVPGT